MIDLGSNIFYDSSVGYEAQSFQVKDRVHELMSDAPLKNNDEICGRCICETWSFQDCEIKREYDYFSDNNAKDCYSLRNTTITLNKL